MSEERNLEARSKTANSKTQSKRAEAEGGAEKDASTCGRTKSNGK